MTESRKPSQRNATRAAVHARPREVEDFPGQPYSGTLE